MIDRILPVPIRASSFVQTCRLDVAGRAAALVEEIGGSPGVPEVLVRYRAEP
jgi:hypothetical protein